MSVCQVQVVVLAIDDLTSFEASWRSLEEDLETTIPFLGYDWLAAWSAVYRPRRLAVVRVFEPRGKTVGLGLVEQLAADDGASPVVP